jgi:hypothetical protein
LRAGALETAVLEPVAVAREPGVWPGSPPPRAPAPGCWGGGGGRGAAG